MKQPVELGSASTAWMRHLVWNGCPGCYRGATAEEDRTCPEGRRLRAASIAEMTGRPVGNKERAGRVWPGPQRSHRQERLETGR